MLKVSSRTSKQNADVTSIKNVYETFGNNTQKAIVNKAHQHQVWMLTSYPPRECGIATFSHDLKMAIENNFGKSVQLKIAAIDNGIAKEKYPKDVSFLFHSNDAESYKQLADTINNDANIKALIIQHEFGLFNYERQADFEQMLRDIIKPVCIVMHTVLPNPSAIMKENVTAFAEAADRIIVMTKNSAALLQEYYAIAAKKIAVIPHGTHLLVPHYSKEALKEKYGVKGKTVLSTFGLISRNKSLETTIKALPAIIQQYPDVVFLALGRTHPCVVKEEGESYREELMKLVKEYKLEDNVRFVNHYLTLQETLEYLQATDIYLFTSKDPLQAVSGTFSYALSAGCAIVSTPIPHAKEILECGCGLLFNFEDPSSLSKQILHYLNNPEFRKKAAAMALETIAPTSWQNIANKFYSLLKKLSNEDWETEYELQPVNLNHLKKMTTKVGLVQFASYHEPDLSSGYTLDDNARALIAAGMHYCNMRDKTSLSLIKRYLNFIKNCQQKDGSFLNYKNEDGSFSVQNTTENLEDANGRAVWALGYIISIKNLPADFGNFAYKIFCKALPIAETLQSPRAMSFVLKGICYAGETHKKFKRSSLFRVNGKKLLAWYKNNAEKTWQWFEPYLTYANSVLPEALLIAYQATGNETFKKVAKESFDFLLSQIFVGGRIKVVSNKGWLNKGEKKLACFGEQPIDVAYTILALDMFYAVFKDETYIQKIKVAYNWFLGLNHLNRIVYNPATGGCYDGIELESVNLNQGAESTVCHLLARIVAEPYFANPLLTEKITLDLPVTSVA